MFNIIKSLIKTSWNLLVVFSLDVPRLQFQHASQDLRGQNEYED